ncbi:MAG: hypothetical protein DMG06_28265, partial [Acidobacteria bacterium]
LSGYDVAKTLVIDPVLSYSTYLGGSQGSQFEGSQFGRSIAIDSVGNAYVFGRTDAADFPITPGALQSAYRQNICGEEVHGPCFDAFVTKLSPQGNSLVYSTYLGGNLDDLNGGIALDSQGNAYVAGSTNSSDYPTTQGALQPALMPGSCELGAVPCTDAFVTKISAQGNIGLGRQRLRNGTYIIEQLSHCDFSSCLR